MKLKIRKLNLSAGRPVAFLNHRSAKKLGVFANDRIAIASSSKKIYAIVDIFSELVGENSLGISKELSKLLKISEGSVVDVMAAGMSEATFIIKKKMSGKRLSRDEIFFLISEIVKNNLTEAEIAYFTAAEKLNGMSMKETLDLTEAMVNTGIKLKFDGKVADKHCIGGIAGNRTSPIVVSICASAGLTLPKTSSRAITSASGTADTMETITKVELPLDQIRKTVKKTGACLVWEGSLKLAPSDDKIIRVERLINLDVEAQFLASIMSKKISAGSKYVLIDIPYGPEAKVKNLVKAKELGKKFEKIANHFGIKLKVVYTVGNQPIGKGVGPVLEMHDVLKVLQNFPDAPQDLKEKALFLSTELMKLCGIKNARKKAEEILYTGKAYKKFKEIINSQNRDENFEEKVDLLKPSKFKKIIRASKSGRIKSISNQKINSLARILGSPEFLSAGIYLHKKAGNTIKENEPLVTLYSESKKRLRDALKFYERVQPIKI